MENNNRKNLSTQNKLLVAIASLFGVAICFYMYFSATGDNESERVVRTTDFDLPGDKNDLKEMWMTKFEGVNLLFEQRLKLLENMILEQKKSNDKKDHENVGLKKEIDVLRESLKELKRVEKEKPVENESYFPFNAQSLAPEAELKRKELREVISTPQKEKIQHVDKAIPAGTTVKAVLVSSVDVPCGVYSQKDPQPVKLQILDDARLPKHVRVKLKGGVIIASAYGDLSNERIYIRTERLTQTKETGDFVETEVTGYITGEDGKYGVRGCLVDRSGRMIKNAALSGFFSGVNQVLQSQRSTNITLNDTDQEIIGTSGTVLRSGGLSGANNAFDRLTDYYIKQADRISPVIQVNAGRIVDITFTHGCEIGDLHAQDKVCEVREKNRKIRQQTCIP